MRWIEILFAVKQDLHDIIQDEDRHDELSTRMKKLLAHASGTRFTDLDGTDVWYLYQAWAETDASFNEYDSQEPVKLFLERLFRDEWSQCRPLGTFDWQDGRQLGTYYSNVDGDVDVDRLDGKPWFPFDYQKAKRFIPNLVVWEDDGTPTSYDIVHDMRPYLFVSGQCIDSMGQYNLKRRTHQRTNNGKLGATQFGVDPWEPSQVTKRSRA